MRNKIFLPIACGLLALVSFGVGIFVLVSLVLPAVSPWHVALGLILMALQFGNTTLAVVLLIKSIRLAREEEEFESEEWDFED